jgi:hypothetical protein
LDSSDHPPRKKTRGYETSRKENLDSIRPEQPFGTANLPPSRARATTFALILDKSEPSSQLIRTAVIEDQLYFTPRGIRVNAVAPSVIETAMSNFTKTDAGRDLALGM